MALDKIFPLLFLDSVVCVPQWNDGSYSGLSGSNQVSYAYANALAILFISSHLFPDSQPLPLRDVLVVGLLRRFARIHVHPRSLHHQLFFQTFVVPVRFVTMHQVVVRIAIICLFECIVTLFSHTLGLRFCTFFDFFGGFFRIFLLLPGLIQLKLRFLKLVSESVLSDALSGRIVAWLSCDINVFGYYRFGFFTGTSPVNLAGTLRKVYRCFRQAELGKSSYNAIPLSVHLADISPLHCSREVYSK